MNKFFSVLKFFKCVNGDNCISLTNLALMVCLYKLTQAPKAGIAEIVPMALALANYSGKKIINNMGTQNV